MQGLSRHSASHLLLRIPQRPGERPMTFFDVAIQAGVIALIRDVWTQTDALEPPQARSGCGLDRARLDAALV